MGSSWCCILKERDEDALLTPERERSTKFRLACLHGKGSNQDVMALQCRTLGLHDDDKIELFYIEGTVKAKAWDGGSGDGYWEWYGEGVTTRKASKLVMEKLCEIKPIDGLVGFSQGAAVVTDIMGGVEKMDEKLKKHLPRFAVLLHGACDSAVTSAAKLALQDSRPRSYPLQTPSFHLVSPTDPFADDSSLLLKRYQHPEVHTHTGPHEITPEHSSTAKPALLEWIHNIK